MKKLKDRIDDELDYGNKVNFLPQDRDAQNSKMYLTKYAIGKGFVGVTKDRKCDLERDFKKWSLSPLTKTWCNLKGKFDEMTVLAVGRTDKCKDVLDDLKEKYKYDRRLSKIKYEPTMPGNEYTKYTVLFICMAFREKVGRGLNKSTKAKLCNLEPKMYTIPEATKKLAEHIQTEILIDQRLEGKNFKGVKSFYIGKTYDGGTQPRWNKHRAGITTKGVFYKVMFVLAEIINLHLPPDSVTAYEKRFEDRGASLLEQFTLSLEESLISHYLFKEPGEAKPPIDNKGTASGRPGTKHYVKYILYVCVDYGTVEQLQ